MKFFPCLAILFACAYALAAEKVYLPSFELTNVHDDYRSAATKLFQRYAEKDGRYEIVTPKEGDSLSLSPSREKIQQVAKSRNCSKFVLGDMTRIGETVIVTVSLYNVQDGKLAWSDAMKAKTPDDIDPILERMGKNVGTGRVASESDDIYNVTQKETEKLRKKRLNRYFGFGIVGLLQIPDPGPQFEPGLDFFWLYDSRNLLLQLDCSFDYYNDTDDKSSFWDFLLGISAYYPLLDRSTTPFIGGGVSYGFSYASYERRDDGDYYSTSETDDNSGILLRAGGGIFFNRTSNVILQIRAEYQFSTYRLQGHFITGPRFAVELGF